MEMYFKRMKDEWTGLVEQADPPIRAKAAEIAVAHAHYLSIEFYRIVRIDPHAEDWGDYKIRPEQVAEHVRERVKIFSKNNTGYVFAAIHNIQYGVPCENVLAAADAAYSYRYE